MAATTTGSPLISRDSSIDISGAKSEQRTKASTSPSESNLFPTASVQSAENLGPQKKTETAPSQVAKEEKLEVAVDTTLTSSEAFGGTRGGTSGAGNAPSEYLKNESFALLPIEIVEVPSILRMCFPVTLLLVV